MPKILIVYYSKTGNTEQIAREIAALCDADIEAIQCNDGADKGIKFFVAVMRTWRKKSSPVKPSTNNPGKYEMVVVGTPVWAFNLTSYTRAYLDRHAGQLPRVAFFCTEGGSGEDRVFQQMSEQIKQKPVATLVINEQELKEKSYQTKLSTFVGQLEIEKQTA